MAVLKQFIELDPKVGLTQTIMALFDEMGIPSILQWRFSNAFMQTFSKACNAISLS